MQPSPETLAASDLGHPGCCCISEKPRSSSLGTWGGARPGSGPKPRAETVFRPLGIRWFVFQTYPQAERLASRELADKGFRVEIPMQLVRERSRKHPRAEALRPMFTGYGFVELDGGEGWVTVREAEGVRKVFTTPAHVPLPVPVGFVEALIASAADRLRLPDIRLPVFRTNTLLRVTAGPLTGHTVRCVRSDGLTTEVEMDLMGRVVPATFPNAALAEWEAGTTEGL